MAATLTISHNLFLTREQRYRYYKGQELEIVGVSVPVWLSEKETSEPAQEMFTLYKLCHTNETALIKHNRHRYEIYIPKLPFYQPPYITNEIWETLSTEEKQNYYDKMDKEVVIKNILDYKDGGCEWLAFRQYSKTKRYKKTLNLVHYVEIKKIEDLEFSLV